MNGLSVDFQADPNRYQYNGKEYLANDGLKWLDYGARYYDPAVARWWSLDPLAEKYTGLSGYNYVANNPLIFVDPDGRKIERTLTTQEDGRTRVDLVYTAKIINLTGAELDMQAQIDKITESITDLWNFSNDEYDVSTTVNITEVSSEGDLVEEDHVIWLMNDGEIPDTGRGNNPEGVAAIGGNFMYLTTSMFDREPYEKGIYAGTGLAFGRQSTIHRTAAHEFGHNLGLLDNLYIEGGDLPKKI